MTRDEITSALANKGITLYRTTKNAAFFSTPDGRKAKLTDWPESPDAGSIADVEAQIAAEAIPAPSAQRKDIHPRNNVHIDRTMQQARRRAKAQRKREKRARLKAAVQQ